MVEEGNDPVYRGQPLHYALSLSLSLSFFLFFWSSFSLFSLALSPSTLQHTPSPASSFPPPSTLSPFRSHRRTFMHFVISVYRLHTVEGTLPPEYIYAVCTRASTCLDEQEDLKTLAIFMTRYRTKIKEASRIASRYSLVNASLTFGLHGYWKDCRKSSRSQLPWFTHWFFLRETIGNRNLRFVQADPIMNTEDQFALYLIGHTAFLHMYIRLRRHVKGYQWRPLIEDWLDPEVNPRVTLLLVVYTTRLSRSIPWSYEAVHKS